MKNLFIIFLFFIISTSKVNAGVSSIITKIIKEPLEQFLNLFQKTPNSLDEIPDNIPYDATTLISKLLDLSKRVGVHQIQDLWLDVGSKEDLKRFEDLI